MESSSMKSFSDTIIATGFVNTVQYVFVQGGCFVDYHVATDQPYMYDTPVYLHLF